MVEQSECNAFCAAEYRRDVKTGRIQRRASEAQNKSKMVYREETERTETQKVYSRLERRKETVSKVKRKEREDSPFNQMQTRGSFDYMADLAGLQSKCSVFKLLLHIALTKETAGRRVS